MGAPYALSSDLVSAWPAKSLEVAQYIDGQVPLLAMTQNAQTGTTYTFVAADFTKLVTLSNASPVAVTLPLESSVAWPTGTQLRLLNQGAGLVTVAGAVGVTINGTPLTLGQYKAAVITKTGTNTWTFLPFSGGSAAPVVSGTTGSPTITSDSNYNYYKFTGSGTITFGTAGQVDILVIGGGGGGSYNGSQLNGGGAGCVRWGIFAVTASAYTVTVGAGGALQTEGNKSEIVGLLSAGGGGPGVPAGAAAYRQNGFGGGGSPGGFSSNSTASFSTPGCGAGGLVYGSNNYDGISLSYSGAAVTYGVGGYTGTNGAANTGNGGYNTGSGGSGLTILRLAK